MRVPFASLLLLGLLPGPLAAEPLLARYEVRAAGLTVLTVEARFELERPRYVVRTEVVSTGVAAVIGSSHNVATTEGSWRGLEPQPQHYRGDGAWRGAERRVALDWVVPGQPIITRLVPPQDADREPVPVSLQQETIDALSALAKLSRLAGETGRCDMSAAVFDGRRRVNYQAVTQGRERLARDGGFAGEALRCAVEFRVLAGRRRDQDPAEAAKPQTANAWLAPALPGRPMIPVRIEVPTRWFGTIRVVLLSVEPASSVE